MNNIEVSVLMSVYNCDSYVEAAVNSILSQTLRSFEFIIIDDCSTDHTSFILNCLKKNDSRIYLLRNKENLGLPKSLNRGLNYCKGTYIARMDADDISAPTRLSVQKKFLEEHNSVDVCGTWINLINSDCYNTGVWKTPLRNTDILSKNYVSPAIAHPTVFWRREKLSSIIKYDENLNTVEDYELWHRVGKFVTFANIPEFLLDYRINNSGITYSSNNSKKNEIATKYTQEKILFDLNIKSTPLVLDYFYKINFNQRLKKTNFNCFSFLKFLILLYLKIILKTKKVSLELGKSLIFKYLLFIYYKIKIPFA